MSPRARFVFGRVRERSLLVVGIVLISVAGIFGTTVGGGFPAVVLDLWVPVAVGCALVWYDIRKPVLERDRRRAPVVAGCAIGGGVLVAVGSVWSIVLAVPSDGSLSRELGIALLTTTSVGVALGTALGHLHEDRASQRRETNRLTHAIDAAMDAIAVVVDGRLDSVNGAYASLYGVGDPARLEGRMWDEGYTNESLVTIEQEAMPALDDCGYWRGDLTGTRIDGTTFRQSVRMTTRDDGTGHVVVARDVTDRIDREQRIQVLNRVLRHNLRNAFTVIRGHANLVGEYDETLERRHVDPIREEIDDLLETADKARGVEQKLERRDRGETIDATDAVRAVVDRAKAAYPGVRIVTRTETPTADSRMPTIEKTVVDALDELVDNAVEHHRGRTQLDRPDQAIPSTGGSNDGAEPLTVEVTAEVVEYPLTSRLEFTVADDGDGIPVSERRAVLQGEETQLAHGSGLGLWFVSWIVNNVGGDLEFTDRQDGGTSVTLSFPYEREENAYETTAAERTV
ncbi:HAMP domain-containing sensor histidine kinase [Natrialba sp. INN-245]|uniref:sensor histidine kinase n=1 Tax=Natrialba sp. INN-245 TaxID=2690967 RepID=UPI0013121A30|nr:HAMP domain-containing sensor histidine kinase [Natrialba sp. INN-245]MWV40832.1 histidine kinase [Natrialba sp. INN-245]